MISRSAGRRLVFFFNDTSTTEIYTLSLHDALPIYGYIPDEYLKRLAATLARIYNKADDPQRKEFVRLSHDDMKELSARIYDALEKGILPPFVSTDEPNNERKGLVAPLANHARSEEHTSELQSRPHLVCRLLLEKKKKKILGTSQFFEILFRM